MTVTVNVFGNLNPAFETSLSLTITGPSNYFDVDFQPIDADAFGEYSFNWVIPDVAGTYLLEVELVPMQLVAYDLMWLEAS